MDQPGACWRYHSSFDLLGALIARAAGQPFEQFLAERIFAPLRMADTGFAVPEAKRGRLAACYQADGATGALVAREQGRFSVCPAAAPWAVLDRRRPLAFGRMLLNGGRHGARAAGAADGRGDDNRSADPGGEGGLAVLSRVLGQPRLWLWRLDDHPAGDGTAAVPGRFGWDGGFGTSWASDPREDLVAILMVQRLYDEVMVEIAADFWTLAYQAIDD